MEDLIDAREFHRRSEAQKIVNNSHRSNGREKTGEPGTAWMNFFGDYRFVYHGERKSLLLTACGFDYTKSVPEDTQNLLGLEETYEHIIKQLLDSKQKKPVIALDYGGGLGITWCRLALRFERQIRAGELLLVVTNMEEGFNHLALIRNRGIADQALSSSDTTTLEHVLRKNLVQYYSAELIGQDKVNIKSLRQLKVHLGQNEVPLIGNTSFIHSRLAVHHTLIPEFHFPRIIELLSTTGVFVESTPPGSAVADGILRAKQETWQYILNPIHKFNVEQVASVEDGPLKSKMLEVFVLRKKNILHEPHIWA